MLEDDICLEIQSTNVYVLSNYDCTSRAIMDRADKTGRYCILLY